MPDDASLAAYLRDRRSRLDPAALGFGAARRRTPGLRHLVLGGIALECSAFAVDGRPDLAMMVYGPASDEVAARIAASISGRSPP